MPYTPEPAPGRTTTAGRRVVRAVMVAALVGALGAGTGPGPVATASRSGTWATVARCESTARWDTSRTGTDGSGAHRDGRDYRTFGPQSPHPATRG